MALEFTKLTEVDNVEEPVDGATVIIENAGTVKRTPMRNIGKVKTINGVEPDEDGNVEIEAGTSIQPIIITMDESYNYSINCAFVDFKALVLAGATVILDDLVNNSTIKYATKYILNDDCIGIFFEGGSVNFTSDNAVSSPPM